MSRRLLDYDPLSGLYTYHSYDEATDTTYIEEVQDVEPYLKGIAELQKEPDYGKKGIKAGHWHVANIPVGVQLQWLREDGIEVLNPHHWERVKRKLNDPNWRALRTSLGRI